MKITRLQAIACLTLAAGSTARADLLSTEKLSLTGDFLLRAEVDWDSQDAGGQPREDRTRMRVRARLGLRFSPDDHWRFEIRLRTGQQQSQQSPHITILDFNGNDTGDTSFDLGR